MIKHFFRPAAIIGALPNNIANGQTSDATTLMADLNWIVNQVNANAAPLTNTALINANNNFTAVQSGLDAVALADFPTAQQVQKSEFLTLSSIAGTGNTITGRAPLNMASYTRGSMFTFCPALGNGGAATININAIGAATIYKNGLTNLSSGDLVAGRSYLIRRFTAVDAAGTGFALINAPAGGVLTAGNALTCDPYATSSSTTQAHGLGAQPAFVTAYMECKSSELNYAVGDRVQLNSLVATLLTVTSDATNVVLTLGTAAISIPDKGTFANTATDPTKWKVVATPYKVG